VTRQENVDPPLKNKKICIVCSSGGHLYQLYLLKSFWEKFDRFWITFQKQDAVSLLKDERKIWAYFPTNRNIVNLFRNAFLAVKILLREKPDIILSNGAGVAIPLFYIGKLFGSKLVYIEVYDRITIPTLTGKLVYPISDRFVVQWKEQLSFYPKGLYLGEIL
jgi:UDP-N-acetylglucosamine:LPS N-acetylglucosamine transferase